MKVHKGSQRFDQGHKCPVRSKMFHEGPRRSLKVQEDHLWWKIKTTIKDVTFNIWKYRTNFTI